jgi:hypothetical protein
MTATSMSDAEAQKEVEDIQAEIAKERGEDPSQKKEDTNEPGDHEAEKDSKDETKEDDTTSTDEEDEVIEPRTALKDDQKVPLSKYQDTKKGLETKLSEKDVEIARLTEELNTSKTSKAIGDKVKAYAEKHSMDESAVLDMVQLIRGENELDTSTKQVIEKSALLIKKQEALDKFQSELNDFITEFPDAAEKAAEIQKLAFAKDNLNKPLYEIYHRFVKTGETVATPGKKTGEVSRGVSRTTVQKFDVTKVVEKINAGTAKPFEGLNDTQIDEVFAHMEKTGSRYSK